MSADSTATPRSLEEIRGDYLSVEDGLASMRSLFRCASLFTALWGIMLVLETLMSDIRTLSRHSWLPKFMFVPDEVTAWHSGIGAALAFALYYLMNYSQDALQPGSGMRHARLLGAVVVTAIAILGPCWAWFFCIGPAITLLNPRSATVLSSKYREVVEATPYISDSNRWKHARDSQILLWITLGGTVFVLASLAYVYWC